MEVKRFLIGSRAIFTAYKDFDDITTDTDILIVVDDEDCPIEWDTKDVVSGMHYVYWRNLPKDELLDYHMHSYFGTYIQKFLVPEYANWIGLTIDELKTLGRLINYLDEHHTYEKIVYDAYIENNAFYLKPEQLEAAYQEYKKARGR